MMSSPLHFWHQFFFEQVGQRHCVRRVFSGTGILSIIAVNCRPSALQLQTISEDAELKKI